MDKGRLIAIIGAVAAVLALQGLAALAWVYSGLYAFSAAAQHTRPVYWAIDTSMEKSIDRRVKGVRTPPNLGDPAVLARGRALFDAHCVQCHGAPGVAPQPFALGLNPPAPPLALTGREWPPARIYWTVKEGLRMTGMPAWKFRMGEDDLWAVAAYVDALPGISAAEYGARDEERDPDLEVLGPSLPGDPARGKVALRQYACDTCHDIPGIVGARAPVGPSLKGLAGRTYIAGVLPNTRRNMIGFIREPAAADPLTAMPDLGVTGKDANDMAAYLETLR